MLILLAVGLLFSTELEDLHRRIVVVQHLPPGGLFDEPVVGGPHQPGRPVYELPGRCGR
jgi:hypothetical protein